MTNSVEPDEHLMKGCTIFWDEYNAKGHTNKVILEITFFKRSINHRGQSSLKCAISAHTTDIGNNIVKTGWVPVIQTIIYQTLSKFLSK